MRNSLFAKSFARKGERWDTPLIRNRKGVFRAKNTIFSRFKRIFFEESLLKGEGGYVPPNSELFSAFFLSVNGGGGCTPLTDK